ncbi:MULTISPECIES: acetoacetate decarboxylase [Staphylococcus]|uniref:acetoacetate decarboxylase n=1 Tax=Staphylococcus TaxID=1279 RepID=UPI001F5713CE|nr:MULTISPECIES: acetoacetate decarboxylase [Staphylococcus]MCI2774028.1 acetoacetate decarboxylase [Staphylococcus petrasii]MCJ1655301.1 acetoacetate decarboxylase [Staphylococcus sp. NRL 21/187]MCJ1661137.1 acetoacetate decarboxylase [Staphylococcus sp. NRL 18/288]MCJ1667030.1 acetoacetate decarboxylase [Staphylococcus sp. NRL 19/737]WEN69506.1 acetoacetate decarboxylase [Staphylococcus sp. NRL 16/872]
MNKEEVKQVLSTPVNAPVFESTEIFFKNREYLNIIYETDREMLEKVVPEPLKVTSNKIKFEVINMPDSTGLGSYQEAGQVIPVEYNGEQGEFYLSMYVNNQAAIASGREVSAFPKKAGQPKLYVDNDVLVGTLDYNSLRVAQATMGYKHHKMDEQEALKSVTAPQFMLKQVRDYDGSLRVCELTRSQITDIKLKEAYRSPARLQLFEHVMAPLADFPVKKIVDAQHIIADLSLGQPKPIFDYLED